MPATTGSWSGAPDGGGAGDRAGAIAGRRDPGGVLADAIARAGVVVEADLVVEGPPGSGVGALRVTGAAEGLAVVIPDLRVARALRAWVRASPDRGAGVLVADAVLRRAGLTLGVHVPRLRPPAPGAPAEPAHEVARLGAGATPGMVSRFAGVGPMDVRWRGVWGALLRR